MLELPLGVARWQAWQRLAELVLAAAESATKAAIGAATDGVERALLPSYRQGLSDV